MQLEELAKVLEKVDDKLRVVYPRDPSQRVMAKTLKIQEEMGELVEAILSWLNYQERQAKNEQLDIDHLAGEWVDVLITVLLLVKEFPFDPEAVITNKMQELKDRFAIA